MILDEVRTRTAGATATGCTGPILARGFTAIRNYFQWSVSDCDNFGFVDSPALPPIDVTGSNLYVAQCTSAPSNNQHNFPPIQMTTSHVAVNDCRLTGNTSLAGIFLDHPAIVVISGDLIVTGGTQLAPPSFQTQFSPGVEVRAGTVRLGPLTSVLGTPLVSAPASATVTFDEPLPSVTATGTTSGNSLTAVITGEAASPTITLAGPPQTPTVLPHGIAFLSPVAPIFDIGFIPPQRQRTRTVAVPPLPIATPIVLQPVSSTATGRIVIGAPTAVLLN